MFSNLVFTSHFEQRLNQRFEPCDSKRVELAIKQAVRSVRFLGMKVVKSFGGVTVVAAPGKKADEVVLVTCYKK